MMQIKKMFLLWVLIALWLSSSAQSKAPHTEIIGTDTSAVIPIQFLRIANAKIVELKECQEENDSLFSQIRTYTGIVNNLRSSILELKQVNTLNQSIINDKDQVIGICGQQLAKASRKNKLLKWERNGGIAACLILIGKVTLFL